MLERMSSAELTEWLAFYGIEPWGGDTDYIGDAITAATVFNVQKGKNKAMKPADFIPKFGQKSQTVEEQIQFAAMVTVALGGSVEMGEDGIDG